MQISKEMYISLISENKLLIKLPYGVFMPSKNTMEN
jgi:hypothetical protein